MGASWLQERVAEKLAATAFLALAFAAAVLSGCTKEEKILEIDTPGGHIEVNKEKPVLD